MSAPTNSDDRIERALLAELAEHRGQKLSREQTADLKWWRKKRAAEIVDSALASIPKKKYCELSDRQVKVINEQAARYDFPIGGPTIDLFEAIRSFHDFLADNADILGDDDDLRKEKLKKEINVLERRAKLLDGEIKQQKSEYVDRRELKRRMAWFSQRVKRLGETLSKHGGREVQEALNDFLEELATEIEKGHLSF